MQFESSLPTIGVQSLQEKSRVRFDDEESPALERCEIDEISSGGRNQSGRFHVASAAKAEILSSLSGATGSRTLPGRFISPSVRIRERLKHTQRALCLHGVVRGSQGFWRRTSGRTTSTSRVEGRMCPSSHDSPNILGELLESAEAGIEGRGPFGFAQGRSFDCVFVRLARTKISLRMTQRQEQQQRQRTRVSAPHGRRRRRVFNYTITKLPNYSIRYFAAALRFSNAA
jgi:hypothetical protein